MASTYSRTRINKAHPQDVVPMDIDTDTVFGRVDTVFSTLETDVEMTDISEGDMSEDEDTDVVMDMGDENVGWIDEDMDMMDVDVEIKNLDIEMEDCDSHYDDMEVDKKLDCLMELD
ncbi:hypothetical protein PFICI_05008 [Pestalotiopsis fici W106-1]|uniref:Uncharacterized protein n=1 Tax=Pestalotiopsis fici (strain W106-1 / CGMCC3.15140) TaxID=1229662 RepID=W3XCF8_PESFW|nr:uncharacterized protein PFICI_05008 [Pestalotiopsis fici W106-1]ETS83132.1 hypothetical protein PFICI_05008 [Pestalotiopsis fici W106-1]